MAPDPLPASKLRRQPDSSLPAFETTADMPMLDGVLGQDRALSAIRFGTGMDHPGYNLFVMGAPKAGRHTIVTRLLKERAAAGEPPPDWIYVHNFQTPHRPVALRLQTGRGNELKRQMDSLLEELRSSLPAIFESDEYRSRRNVIQAGFEQRHEQAFEGLRKKAQEHDIVMIQTPRGFAFAPIRDGEVMRPEVFQTLPEAERKAVETTIGELEKELQGIIEHLPRWDKERREGIRALNREIATYAITHAFQDIRRAFADLPECLSYFDNVQSDMIENVEAFLMTPEEGGGQRPGPPPFLDASAQQREAFRRYAVNVVVDNAGAVGAPVVTEDNPSLQRLIGRVEHIAQFGALITDFTLIKPGALHKANGGYLILDVLKVLSQPFAWETLKRTLRAGQIRIESPNEMYGFVSTVSLEPEPIPLNVKVVLIGERVHYYLLNQIDHDFADLFKVVADFEEVVPWSPVNMERYVSLIASIVGEHRLRPISRAGVGAVIEHSARLADDAERLTLEVGHLSDLLREANFWAAENGHSLIEAADIQQAIDAQKYRLSRVHERALEAITRDIMLIESDGAVVGQINGLTVSDLGGYRFGRPARITAKIALGSGKVIDIEREVELGGPIHSKGVLILAGYLNAMFGGELPLSLSASLVFEQSYGGVDGDSASSTELYALLSAISGIPIKQSLAVTGSVNQNGEVQAIGGVNEKIEGFFDVCSSRGLTGTQGVLIPKANEKHLMLRQDIVEAAKAGQFHVYSVSRIEDGIELLTGVPAGRRDSSGDYPEGTVFRRAADRLRDMALARRNFAAQSRPGTEA